MSSTAANVRGPGQQLPQRHPHSSIFSKSARNFHHPDSPLVPRQSQLTCLNGENTKYTARNSETFVYHCGVDYPGNDAYTTQTNSMEDCIEVCAAFHPLCYAVVWIPTQTSNTCLIKDRLGISSALPSAQVAIASFAPAAQTCKSESSIIVTADGSRFQLSCGLDIVSSDMVQYHAANITECINYCATYGPKCLAVTYEAAMTGGYNNCYLKSQGSPLKQNTIVVDVAVRIGAASSSRPAAATSTSSPSIAVSTSNSSSHPTSSSAASTASSLTTTTTPIAESTPSTISSSSPSLAWVAGAVLGPLFLIALLVLAIILFRRRQASRAALTATKNFNTRRESFPYPFLKPQELPEPQIAEGSGQAMQQQFPEAFVTQFSPQGYKSQHFPVGYTEPSSPEPSVVSGGTTAVSGAAFQNYQGYGSHTDLEGKRN